MATYTGTTGTDSFTGANNVADTFLFTPSTLSSADTVYGGTGNVIDTLQFTAAGTISDVALSHVLGIEQVILADGTNSLTLPSAAITDDNAATTVLTIKGGAGSDSINASQDSQPLVIYAGGGNDTLIDGKGGTFGTPDQFIFHAGDLTAADTVQTATGYGEIVIDTAGTTTAADLAGVSGVQFLRLTTGGSVAIDQNYVAANAGYSGVTIYGSDQNDRIDASATTALSSAYLTTTMIAGGGNDTLIGGSGIDEFQFNPGQLTGADTVNGGGGNDELILAGAGGTIAAADLAGVSGVEGIIADNITAPNSITSGVTSLVFAGFSSGPVHFDLSAIQTFGVTAYATFGGNNYIKLGGGADTVYDEYLFSTDTLIGSGNDTLITGKLGDYNDAGVSGFSSITGNATLSDAFFARNAATINVLGAVDASAVTDPTHAVNDVAAFNDMHLYGGAGADTFSDLIDDSAGEHFSSGSIVNGGGGSDTLIFRDGGTLSQTDFAGVTGIETIHFLGATQATLADAMVASANGAAMSVFGSSLNDTIDGSNVTAGHSLTLGGGSGDDQLTGGAGDDTLDGGTGYNVLNGGDGNDTATYYDASSGVTVSLAITHDQVTGYSNDTLYSIENITGSLYDDTLTGDAGDNTLRGLAGDDHIVGGDGDDSISGGIGNDYLDGGAGIDTVSYSGDENGAVHVDLAITGPQDTGGAGTDTLLNFENLLGSNFNDVLYGNAGANTIIGYSGDDTIYGRDGDDNLQGRDGNDILVGGNGNDIMDGGDGIDAVSYTTATSRVIVSLLTTTAQNTQGAGIDTITHVENLIGSNYNDILSGDSGNNTISGGNGDDIIAGRYGADTLIGGAGADHFVWYSAYDSPATGYDTVNDMTSADYVDLTAVDANTKVAGDQAFALVSAFSHVAGQATLTYNAATNQTMFLGDTDGDGKADFAIRFLGDVTHYTDHFLL